MNEMCEQVTEHFNIHMQACRCAYSGDLNDVIFSYNW